jgi:hypothetical protein
LPHVTITALAHAAAAIKRGEQVEMPIRKQVTIAAPVAIDRQLAMIWSFCAWGIADAKGKVSEAFRIGMIQEYLDLVLALHCQPSAIPVLGSSVTGLESWRDLFLEEIRNRFAGSSGDVRESLARAFRDLDRAKKHVLDGSEWLKEQLKIE